MTDLDTLIARVRELDAAATKGPWVIGNTGTQIFDTAKWTAHAEADSASDAALITYYRTAAPALADEVERLRAENAPHQMVAPVALFGSVPRL